jgi:cytochrome P450
MQTLTNVLYRLISNPEYVESLRHDVETAVSKEGWTKAGMDKMHKIDSFIRETQRVDDLNSCLLGYPSRISVTDAFIF